MKIPEHIQNRKGARSLKDINPEVIEFLNAGKVETKNLMEWLATDQLALLKRVLSEIDKLEWYVSFETPVNQQKKRTANSDVKIIGQTFGLLSADKTLYQTMSTHASDIVRCWSCWAESIQYDDLSSLLATMKTYAADQHFGVREVVIFATKEYLIEQIDLALEILGKWTRSPDDNIRRYAVEALRPVGVWTKKIEVFQNNPEKAVSILEPLMSDGSKYVRDSVGNWINDASKSQATWVKEFCSAWETKSSTKETAYIIKKGMRTINK